MGFFLACESLVSFRSTGFLMRSGAALSPRRATHFSLLRQRKVSKRKATLVSASGFSGRVRDRIRVKSHLCSATIFIAAYARITRARGRKHLRNRRTACFFWSDIAFRPCHDRRRMPCEWLRLSFESYAGSGKALDALGQSSPRLCRLRPGVASVVLHA